MWTARQKSLVFSASLLAVCAAIVVGAAFSTHGFLAPFAAGEEWASERPVARGTSALTVLVGAYEEGELVRVENARVTLSRATLGEPEHVLTATTGPDGRVAVDLARGPYFVEVERDGSVASEGIQLEGSERVAAYFLADGTVAWRRVAHADLEAHGDVARLRVLALDRALCRPEGEGTYCAAIPEPGARIDVERAGRHVATGWTGTGEALTLPVGEYVVRTTLDGRTARTSLLLVCDAMIDVVFDGEEARVERQGCPRQAVGIPSG